MMRLDELAARQFGVTVQQAAALIMEGRVFIGDQLADKPGLSVPAETKLTLRDKCPYASRSGYKLEKALNVFGIDPSKAVYPSQNPGYPAMTVCDIGASNGGFTDCLLQRGAGHVFAVDVAYGILAWELRQNPKVTVLDRTNARYLTLEQLGLTTGCDMVTVDVSFISLTKIFPAIHRILTTEPGGLCVCLFKPQFEAPRHQLGKHGMVKDPAILLPLFQSLVQAAASHQLYLRDFTPSPIRGQHGNVEYLACFSRTPILTEPQQTGKLQAGIASGERTT